MVTTITPAQPAFMNEITANLRDRYKDTSSSAVDLVIQEPDYSKPLGTLDNLFRTTIYLGEPGIAPQDNRAVFVSNVLYADETVVVLFVNNPSQPNEERQTRYYQPQSRMMVKEHLVSNMGYRPMSVIQEDIDLFLTTNAIPAQ